MVAPESPQSNTTPNIWANYLTYGAIVLNGSMRGLGKGMYSAEILMSSPHPKRPRYEPSENTLARTASPSEQPPKSKV